MRPVRGMRSSQSIRDPWTDAERETESTVEAHALNDAGALESVTTRCQQACACGCIGPPGGYCVQCDPPSLVCQRCLARCERCGRPLCPRHTARSAPKDAASMQCHGCEQQARSQARVRSAVRFLLSPFVELRDEAS